MVIEVREAEDADMLEIFSIASRSFARNEPFFDNLFPEHWTETGRKVGAERYLELQRDPNVKHVKAVDTENGKIAGFIRWITYSNRMQAPLPADVGPYWSNPDEKEHISYLLPEFVKMRQGPLEETGGNLLALDVCAVNPDYQRKGVGAKLVGWGTKLADEKQLEASVESSVPGRGLYEKHGFVYQRTVVLAVPDKFAAYPKSSFEFLVRPKKSAV